MSYVPTKVPQVQNFIMYGTTEQEAAMYCEGCKQVIYLTSLQQAVAQADLHEQEKHLVDLYELPAEISQAV